MPPDKLKQPAAVYVRGVLLAGFLVPLGPGIARSQTPDTQRQAQVAYDRGKVAYDAGVYAAAASQFAQADSLVPNPAVLAIALDAVTRADDPVLGMTLVERGEARRPAAKVAPALRAARVKFAGRVARVAVACDGCFASIDGTSASLDQGHWLLPGHHLIDLTIHDRVEHHPLDVAAGAAVRVEPEPRPPEPATPLASPAPIPVPVPPGTSTESTSPASQPLSRIGTHAQAASGAPPSARPLSPLWFAVGAGVTTALAGVTAVSGLDTLSKKNAFEANPTRTTQSDGQAAQTRTNELLAATGIVAAATAAVGIFLVQWSSRGSGTVGVSTFVSGLGGGVRFSY